MQTVALKPKRAEWTVMTVGLFLLCVAMIMAPAFCIPLAMAAPLLACPLSERKKEKMLAWLSAAVPVASSLAAGYDALYALSLLLIGLAPLLITRFIPLPKRPGAKGMLLYVAAMTCSVLVVLAAAGRALGGPLQLTLAEAFTRWVEQSEQKELILRRFAASGMISIPKGYADGGVANQLMQPAHIRQMLMSLRLTMEMVVVQYLPKAFVQGCLVVGLFIPLRLERVNGVLLVVETKTPSQKQTRVVAPPSFRLLTLPLPMRTVWLMTAVTGLLLMTSSTDVVRMTGQLCYAAAEAVAYLLGAAVLVFMYTKNDPDRRVTAGAMAVLLYLFAPFILLAIGIADQVFHFRTPQAQKPDRT